jgi:hypothetical protein
MPQRPHKATESSDHLLADWHKTFGHGNATAVLGSWADQSFSRSFRSLLENQADHEALLYSFISKIEPFDCLLIAGWQPVENQLSDVIAALFNAKWGHPFSQGILHFILGALLRNEALLMETRDLIIHIQHSLEKYRMQTFVRRERRDSASRADIDVYAPGPEGFLLRIEHKTRGGRETVVNGIYQTQRLWRDAVCEGGRAARLGIDQNRVIGVFLTPDGEPAKSSHFLALSFDEFADAVIDAVTVGSAGGAERPSSAAASILGFMSFYRRA